MAREPAPITAAAGSAANATGGGGGGPPGQQKKRERKPQRPTNPDSKNQKKKARKKAKKIAQASWCWYCDREFEDDRILLSHQKAKHFRCPHCPRRLNTAGGLAVHIDQVHKLPVDKIENTLPGRDSFDIEIYGMEGIPKNDLEEWKRKRNTELGLEAGPTAKRPRIFKGVITIDDLAKQLAVHKSLMRQSKLRNQQGPPGQMQPGMMPGMMPGAPPPMMPPQQAGASPFPMLPGVPMPPPGMFPMPPNIPLPPGFGSPMPGAPVPGGVPPPVAGAFPPPAGMSPMPMQQQYQGQVPAPFAQPAPAPLQAPYVASSSRAVQKSGQVHIYADSDVSYEEKRAKNPKYAQTVAASSAAVAPASTAVPAQAAPVAAPSAAPAVPAQASPASATADDSNPKVTGGKRARAADLI